MKEYKKKMKNQLHEELKELRQLVEERKLEIDESETEGKECVRKSSARSPREELHTDIEFIGDFDIVKAKVINLSESGICFELKETLPFEVKFKINGIPRTHRAHLVWMKQVPGDGYRFGLKFVRSEPHPTL